MTLKKALMSAFCALFALTASAAFAASALDKDTLIFGTESTFPPYEFRSTEGELVGYDIDLAAEVCKHLGKKIEWVDMAYDSLIPSVMMHKIDVIAAGMSASPARQKRVSFTIPVNNTPSAFFVLKGNEHDSAEAFNGKVIAVQLGTIQDAYAANVMKGVTVKTYKKSDDCMREVLYGRVDAALLSGSTGHKYAVSKDFAGKISMCAVTDVVEGSSGSAFAIAKDQPELLAAVNGVLEEMKKDGMFQQVRDKWGMDDWLKDVWHPAK